MAEAAVVVAVGHDGGHHRSRVTVVEERLDHPLLEDAGLGVDEGAGGGQIDRHGGSVPLEP